MFLGVFFAATLPFAFLGVTAKTSKVSASDALVNCLRSLGGAPKVISPIDASYPTALLGKDFRFTFRPAAIVFPTTEPQVRSAVLCAASAGNVTVAPRSGGHSYEGYSQGGSDGALLIDLAGLNGVNIDSAARTAVVGPGVALAPLYYKLFQKGFALPAGTCPTVGAGGLTLGGGFGLLSRKFGLALDNVQEFRLVDARGALVVANANSNADLFYALRGAGGGSFGIVTSIAYNLNAAPKVVTSFTFEYPSKSYQRVMNAYNKWGPTAVGDVTTEMNWSGSDGFELQGLYLGPKSELKAALKGFTDVAGAADSSDIRQETLIDSILRFTYIDSKDPASLQNPKAEDARYMKGNSIMYEGALSKATLEIMRTFLDKKPQGSTAAYAIIDLWGGRVIEIPETQTAFVHRDKLFGIELVVEWGESDAKPGKPDCQPCIAWIGDFMDELSAQYLKENTAVDHISAYQNYIDRGLKDWQKAYYGDAFQKLVTIKNKYDPTNVFRNPQSIPITAN